MWGKAFIKVAGLYIHRSKSQITFAKRQPVFNPRIKFTSIDILLILTTAAIWGLRPAVKWTVFDRENGATLETLHS